MSTRIPDAEPLPDNSLDTSKVTGTSGSAKLMLFIFLLQQLMVGMAITAFTSMPGPAETVFNVSQAQLVLTTSALVAGVLTGGFINLFLMSHISLKTADTLFGLLSVASQATRLLSFDNFHFAYLAQFIHGLANAMIIMSIMRFFRHWFSPEATRLLLPFVSTAAFIGNVLGVLIPQLIIDSHQTDPAILRGQFHTFFLAYLGWGVFVLLFSLLCFRDRPASYVEPAHHAAASHGDEARNMLRSGAFWRYGLLVGIARGLMINIFGMLPVLFKALGANPNFAFLTLLSFLALGFLGTLVFNKLLDRKRDEQNFVLFISASVLLIFTAIVFADLQRLPLFYTFFVAAGLFFVNQMPMSMNYAMSHLRVTNVSFVNSFYFLLAQAIAFSGQNIFAALLHATDAAGLVFLNFIGYMGVVSIFLALL